MSSTVSVEIIEEFQSLLAKLNSSNIETISKRITELISPNTVFSFVANLGRIIVARTSFFTLFCQLLKSLDIKNEFISYFKTLLLEPNQPECSSFFGYLIEEGYITYEEGLDVFLSCFEHAERLDNIVFLQLLYPIIVCGKHIKEANAEKYSKLIGEFELRKQNISIGVNLDENAEIFTFLLDEFYQIQSNNFAIQDDFPMAGFIEAVRTDNPSKCIEALKETESFEPTLLAPSSVISFNPPLACVAAFFGAIKCVKAIASEGFDLSEEDDEGRNIAMFAAMSGNVELLQYLHSLRISFNKALPSAIQFWQTSAVAYLKTIVRPGGEAILAAAEVNNIAELKALIDAGVDCTARDDYYWTPLHLAASHNSLEAVRLLLPKVDINTADLDGDTPLHCAAKEGYAEIVRTLIADPRIDINKKDKDDAAPMHWAAFNGKAEIIKILVDAPKINVNAQDGFKRTPLNIAAQAGAVEVVKTLLGVPKIQVNIADGRHFSPLISATEKGYLEIVQLLAKAQGIDPNVRNDDDCTALEIAAFAEREEIFKTILAIPGVQKSRLTQAKRQLSQKILDILNV